MTVKLLEGIKGNDEKTALVNFSAEEFCRMGLSENDLTLQKAKTRLLLGKIFATVEETCGLHRDGHYVAIACRPLKNGGCRFLLHFSNEPSGRLFYFSQADDLLDALNQLKKRGEYDVISALQITYSGGNYKIYIPPEINLSESAQAVIREYGE